MTPLNKWKRRILFFALVIVFIILAPWVLLNSFGYRWEDTFSFTETGGVYLHTEVTNGSLFINGKYIKDNRTIIRNILVQKLKPNNTYSFEFRKGGHHTWKKQLPIYPGIVTEGHVLAIPNIIETTEIFPFFDQEGKGSNIPITGFTQVSKTKDGRIIPENEDYINMVTLFEGENPYEIKVPEVVVSVSSISDEVRTEEDLMYEELGVLDKDSLNNLIESTDELMWIEKGDIVVYWIGSEESIPYYYCEGGVNKICNDEISLDWVNEIKSFALFPKRGDVWLVLSDDGLFAVEVDPRSERNVQPVYVGNNIDFRIDTSGTIFVEDKGSFFELDF